MHYTLIINPTSGGGKAQKQWPRIQSALDREKIGYNHFFTTKKGHAISLARELALQGHRHFVVVGGDGTLNEVLNGLCSQNQISVSEFVLGCIPIGTASDWIKFHNIPSAYLQAVKLLKEPVLKEHDIGVLDHGDQQRRYFINVAGLAFDAFVVQRTEEYTMKGWMGHLFYLSAVLLSLRKYHSPAFAFTVEGERYQGALFCLNVGICQYSGGGMRLVPLANSHDGLLDITVIEKMSLWEVLRNLHYLYNGKLYDHPKARHFRTSHIEVHTLEEAIPLEVDGEFIGHTPAVFSLHKDRLKVVVPKR